MPNKRRMSNKQLRRRLRRSAGCRRIRIARTPPRRPPRRTEFIPFSAPNVLPRRSLFSLREILQRHQRLRLVVSIAISRAGAATAAAAGPPAHDPPAAPAQVTSRHSYQQQRHGGLPIEIAHRLVFATGLFVRLNRTAQRAVLQAADPGADLVSRQRANIGQHRHIAERERRPAPTVRFALDHGERRSALRA